MCRLALVCRGGRRVLGQGSFTLWGDFKDIGGDQIKVFHVPFLANFKVGDHYTSSSVTFRGPFKKHLLQP